MALISRRSTPRVRTAKLVVPARLTLTPPATMIRWRHREPARGPRVSTRRPTRSRAEVSSSRRRARDREAITCPTGRCRRSLPQLAGVRAVRDRQRRARRAACRRVLLAASARTRNGRHDRRDRRRPAALRARVDRSLPRGPRPRCDRAEDGACGTARRGHLDRPRPAAPATRRTTPVLLRFFELDDPHGRAGRAAAAAAARRPAPARPSSGSGSTAPGTRRRPPHNPTTGTGTRRRLLRRRRRLLCAATAVASSRVPFLRQSSAGPRKGPPLRTLGAARRAAPSAAFCRQRVLAHTEELGRRRRRRPPRPRVAAGSARRRRVRRIDGASAVRAHRDCRGVFSLHVHVQIGASAALPRRRRAETPPSSREGPPCTAPRTPRPRARALRAGWRRCRAGRGSCLAEVIVGAHADRATPASQGTSPPTRRAERRAPAIAGELLEEAIVNADARAAHRRLAPDISTSETNGRNSRASDVDRAGSEEKPQVDRPQRATGPRAPARTAVSTTPADRRE